MFIYRNAEGVLLQHIFRDAGVNAHLSECWRGTVHGQRKFENPWPNR